MSRTCILLLLLALAPGAAASAQQACPWLTQGTAAALLGGDVDSSAHVSSAEGTCDFIRTTAHLTIAVAHLQPKECPTGERLTGIGQDAVLCEPHAAKDHRQIIRGRVRTTWFLLTLATADAAFNKASSRRSLEQAAEEVAGNLF